MSAKIFHADLYGRRADKYQFLGENDLSTTEWTELKPQGKFYLFKPYDAFKAEEYEKKYSVSDIFVVAGVGMTTARDHVVIAFDRERLLNTAKIFRDSDMSEREVCAELRIPLKKGWNIARARELIRQEKGLAALIRPVTYRPFDTRVIFYHDSLVWRTVKKIMRHMLAGENVGLLTTRQTRDMWDSFATRQICTHKSCAAYDINSLFPLYLYPDPDKRVGEISPWPAGKNGRRPNLNPEFVRDMEARLEMKFVTDGKGDLGRTAAVPAAVPGASRPRQSRQDACDTAGEDAGDTAATFGPEDVFNYIYAVFHSPTYRQRYAQFLKIDFPKLPLTSDHVLFAALCALGAELVGLHLMESPELDHLVTSFPVPGSHVVEKGHPKYLAPGDPEPGTGNPLQRGRVYISKNNTKINTSGQYFDGVPPEIWDFRVGGYPVCEKWLKDRRGRALSHDDLLRYQKIVVALKETIRIMREIDAAIPQWPIE